MAWFTYLLIGIGFLVYGIGKVFSLDVGQSDGISHAFWALVGLLIVVSCAIGAAGTSINWPWQRP